MTNTHRALSPDPTRTPEPFTRLAGAVLAIGLVAAPYAALAQGPGGPDGPRRGPGGNPWEHISERFDTNGDAVVTLDEFQSEDARRSAERFEHMDRNDDGQLTAADFEGLERRRHRARFGASMVLGPMLMGIDTDSNREVSAEEWQSFLVAIDADGDGTIAREEIEAHGQAQRELRGLPERPALPEDAPDMLAKMMEHADRDGNGTLETSDLQTTFDELDANDDGQLGADELPRFRHRGERSSRGAERGFGKSGEHRTRGLGMRLFHKADADQNQELTEAEWQSYLAGLDEDGDGQVSFQELRGSEAPEAGPMIDLENLSGAFGKADANGDGIVAGDEWPRRRHRHRDRQRAGAGDTGTDGDS